MTTELSILDIADLERELGIEGISAEKQLQLIASLQQSATDMIEKVKLQSIDAEKLLAEKQEILNQNVEFISQGFAKVKDNLDQKFEKLNSNIQGKVSSFQDILQGKQGKDGKPGLKGDTGPAGKNGAPGKDGVDGADGISVTDAKIDFDGSLIITLSTGKELNVGEVVAPELAEKIKVISTMSTNGAVAILDEGTSITSGVKKINFVGATVTATNSGDDVTVNVSAGTGTVTSVAATVPSFLSVTGSPITTSGTLAIALASTPTDGQLLIGNGTGFSYATLTAGSNITITNSAGGITIASSGGGGGSSPIPKLLSWSIGGF